ncbi:MAG: glycosyltransferase family 2 protein [Pedobacter sp.]|nr:MAG: glycosyltransferase family 2 protein [Pedobacter sp.]
MLSLHNKTGVSLVICCFNSENRISKTLQFIAAQRVPEHIDWEILLIDNACTDATVDIAIDMWNNVKSNCNLKVITEMQPGLSFARKTAIKEAQFEYILFCDDDNWLHPEYVFNVYTIMSKDTTIAVLGGCGVFEPEKPLWKYSSFFQKYYVNGAQTWAKSEHWVYGASATIRKTVIQELYDNGWEQITTGRKKTKLSAGEDVEICFMCYLMGHKIVYDDRLTFKHFVPKSRQNINYLKRVNYGIGYSHVLLNCYYMFFSLTNTTIERNLRQWLFKASINFMKAFVLSLFKVFTNESAEAQKEQLTFQRNYGSFISLLNNRRKIAEHYHIINGLIRKTSFER